MRRFSFRCIALGLISCLLVFGLDQGSKYIFLQKYLLLEGNLSQHAYKICDIFNLVLVWNHGISFGLFSRFDQRLFLIAGTGFISFILLIGLLRSSSMLMAISLGAIIGGALGNIVDRVRLGAVADFFDFHIGDYHWPAFNIADSFIFIGVVVLCIRSMFADTASHDKD